MKRISTTKTIGKGWVGRWRDNTLGWFLPTHCSGWSNWSNPPNESHILKGEKVYLCKITVEQIFKKNGRAITRNVK